MKKYKCIIENCKMDAKFCFEKATTPGVPKRSPIQVLTRPYVV